MEVNTHPVPEWLWFRLTRDVSAEHKGSIVGPLEGGGRWRSGTSKERSSSEELQLEGPPHPPSSSHLHVTH